MRKNRTKTKCEFHIFRTSLKKRGSNANNNYKLRHFKKITLQLNLADQVYDIILIEFHSIHGFFCHQSNH